MKKSIKIIIIVFSVVILIGASLFWMYRNPKFDYESEEKLKSIPTICVVETYFNMPVPVDISENWHEWGETLVEYHFLYEQKYESHDVNYKTTLKNGETIVEFTGNGTKADGETEEIYDMVVLPFELYGG